MFNYFAQSSIVIAKAADSADRGIEHQRAEEPESADWTRVPKCLDSLIQFNRSFPNRTSDSQWGVVLASCSDRVER